MRDTTVQALRHLRTALTNLPRLEAAWRHDGDLSAEESLAIEVGEPDAERLADLEREHAELTGRRLPPSLQALWSTFNGLAVSDIDDIESHAVVHRRPARDLGEPGLWPVTVYGDHFLLIDTDLITQEQSAPLIHPLVFGDIADVGYLLLVEEGGAPGVYWQDRELQHAHPIKLANELGEFIHEWAESALRLPKLLRRAGVRGWTG